MLPKSILIRSLLFACSLLRTKLMRVLRRVPIDYLLLEVVVVVNVPVLLSLR